MDLKSQTGRRAEACQQRDSHLDLSDRCRESDLGSAAHSRRTSEAGFRGFGKECLAMDPASSQRSRSRETMADVPQKPSRGNCCNGLLHRPNAHVRCSVLLFRYQPRPNSDRLSAHPYIYVIIDSIGRSITKRLFAAIGESLCRFLCARWPDL
jgi:hypothetical protein